MLVLQFLPSRVAAKSALAAPGGRRQAAGRRRPGKPLLCGQIGLVDVRYGAGNSRMVISEPAGPQIIGKSIKPVGRRAKVRLSRRLLLRHTMDAASILIDSIHV